MDEVLLCGVPLFAGSKANLKWKRVVQFCAPYEVGGGYSEEELQESKGNVEGKLDPSEYEALLKGGEQVTSVLEEMITLMNEASESVAVELAAQGVIGKRVDEMESGFMMALDYMIQLADKDQDDKRKALLEVVKETVLSHLTKKCPPHVQVIGLLCRTPKKESRHELLRRVAVISHGGDTCVKGRRIQLPDVECGRSYELLVGWEVVIRLEERERDV